jgi:hypothetical protein
VSERRRSEGEWEREERERFYCLRLTRSFSEQQNALQRELILVSKERYAMDEACYAISLLEKHVGAKSSEAIGYREIEENFYSHWFIRSFSLMPPSLFHSVSASCQ